MSIKTEIDRIKQSKADIISALTTKGINVPSDVSIDDLSALVEAISTSEDLSSELSTQNNLITTQETTIDNIISALQGKASGGSGGASIDTCTVKISCYPDYGAYVMAFSVMVWDGEKIAIVTDGDTTKAEFTIENVICGSFISFNSSAGFNRAYSTNVETMPSASSGYYVSTAAKIVAPSGGNAVLAITPAG